MLQLLKIAYFSQQCYCNQTRADKMGSQSMKHISSLQSTPKEGVKRSISFSSDISYPEIHQFSVQKEPQKRSKGEKVDSARIASYPYNTVGLIVYQNSKGERNYSTGFLITSCLVLTAANPTLVRCERSGVLEEYVPIFFMTGEGIDKRVYEVHDFCRSKQYGNILMELPGQDYLHANLKTRLALLAQAQGHDFCLIKIGENSPSKQYLSLLGDFDCCGQNRAIAYNYQDRYEQYAEQDKEMVIGQFVYSHGYIVEEERLRMDFAARKTVIGAPIIVKYRGHNTVVGLLIRSSRLGELSAGLLLSNSRLEIIKGWILTLNQFPKVLVFRPRKSSQEQEPHRKSTEDLVLSEIIQPQPLSRSSSAPESQVEFWNKDTMNSNKFQFNNFKVRKVKYTGQTHQVVSHEPINSQPISIARVRLVQYGGKYAISIGLINRNRINKRYSGDYNQTESIGLWTFNYGRGRGRFFIGGESPKGWDQSCFVQEGSVLTIRIKSQQGITQWLIGQKQIGRFQLPPCLKNQQLFLFVSMERKNDCVQFLK